MKRGDRASHWPWRPFVGLALAAAVLPGFLLGGAMMVAATRLGEAAGPWYAAARQAHGHAQLVGWGGAMILGVGLHFLPRVRGAPAGPIPGVRVLFALFAAGLGLRLVAQPAAALAAAGGAAAPARMLHAAYLVGAGVEAVAVLLLLASLAAVLRQGPPLRTKRGFLDILPFLAVSGAALVLSLVAWTMGALRGDAPGVAAGAWDRLAVQSAVGIFIPGISLAMSVRLFPLFFRVQAARRDLTTASAALLALSLAAVAWAGLAGAPGLYAWAGILQAGALLLGSAAVRILERRRTFPGDRAGYAALRDPAAVAAVSAYAWAWLAAAALLVGSLGRLLPRAGLPTVPVDLAVHALGAGFMTLLILGVGAVLLPGFAGGKPTAPGLVWASVAAAHAAAALRVAPWLAALWTGHGPTWTAEALAGAGVAGMAAVVIFALYLRRAWAGEGAG